MKREERMIREAVVQYQIERHAERDAFERRIRELENERTKHLDELAELRKENRTLREQSQRKVS